MLKHIPSKAKNISLYLFSQALRVTVPIITLPVYTRLIPPNDYGVIDMFNLVMIIGLGLGNWGLQNSFDRYFFEYANDKKKQLRLLGTLTTFSIFCLFLVVLSIFPFNKLLANYLAHSPKWGFLLILVLVSGYFDYINMFFFYFLRNSNKAFLYAKFDLLKIVLSTGLSLYFILNLKFGVWGIAYAQSITLIIIFVLFIIWFGIPSVFVIDWKILKESFSYGWPLMTKVLLNILNVSIDKFMVGTIVSLGALGIYSRAQTISYAVFTLMTTIYNVYGPEWNTILFAQRGAPIKSLSKSFTEFVCIISFPTAVVIVFCKEIFIVLLSKEYRGAMPLLVILAFYYALLAFGVLQGAITAYLKMSKFVAITMFISYPLNIGLNLLLIPRFGATGSVVSTLIVGICMLIITRLYIRKHYQIKFEAAKLSTIYGILASGCAATILSINNLLPAWIDVSMRISLFIVFIVTLVRIIGAQKITTFLSQIKPLNNVSASQ